MEKLPQRLVNVRVADRDARDGGRREVAAASATRERRRSRAAAACSCARAGTEPLVRVMVEAPTAEEADDVCARLVAVVERVSPVG